MIPYDPAEPLISFHIPKSGGTSLAAVLENWFPDGRLLPHYRNGDAPPLRHPFTGSICIHGHFNAARDFGIRDYYPQARQFITFLREPFDRFVSQWLFLSARRDRGIAARALVDKPHFEDWLRGRVAAQREGQNDFSLLWQLPAGPRAEDIIASFEGAFVFVGIMERYAESLSALAAIFGRQPPPLLPHLNATTQGRDELQRYRRIYEQQFEQEYAVYEAGLRLNAAAISKYSG